MCTFNDSRYALIIKYEMMILVCEDLIFNLNQIFSGIIIGNDIYWNKSGTYWELTSRGISIHCYVINIHLMTSFQIFHHIIFFIAFIFCKSPTGIK